MTAPHELRALHTDGGKRDCLVAARRHRTSDRHSRLACGFAIWSAPVREAASEQRDGLPKIDVGVVDEFDAAPHASRHYNPQLMFPPVLKPHRLRVALLQPQIAPNTGNIARLCVATGTELHLVRPMGFILSDKELRRSAMDYWPRLKLTLHDDTAAFQAATASERVWYFSSKATTSLWDADFQNGDWLVFGSETRGIDESILAANASRALRIPQAPDERCLNLSTAAGVALYEALRCVTRPISPAPPDARTHRVPTTRRP